MFIGLMGAIGLAGPPWMQWLVFTILSVILLLVFRRPILRMMNVDTGPVDSLVGEVATVLDADRRRAPSAAPNCAAAPGPRAIFTAPNLARGQRCRVERVDGLMLFLLPE